MTTRPNPTEAARSATADAKETAKDLARNAREAAEEKAEQVKETAADHAQRSAEEIRREGSNLSETPYAREAAMQISDGLTRAATAIRDTDFASLQDDLTNFARRNPAVFYGAAAALGFVVGRALKASERAEPHEVHRPEQYAEWPESPAEEPWGAPR